MDTPTTVYAIDAEGNFLGGYGGGVATRIQDVDGVPTAVQSQVTAALPEGAIIVASAPTDRRAKFGGFTVSNGAAVGGAWDYSAIPATPDVVGFIAAAKAALGGILAVQALGNVVTLAYAALQAAEWTDFATLVVNAKNTYAISADQYAAFQGLVTTYHIPATLP